MQFFYKVNIYMGINLKKIVYVDYKFVVLLKLKY